MSNKLIVPILTIVVGVTWLLNVMGIMPGVDWVWTVGLAAAGILSIAIGGLNKITVVTGPFLITGSVCSLLRQTGRLPVNYEIPILIIVLGILMFISQLSRLPLPESFREEDEKSEK
ncbi:MAG: hypothetical protein KKB51_09245 [Candidatus Riflebacteria bacterium]|nr:hypothetical protein [Candidatus Riflebacteria bacterium]